MCGVWVDHFYRRSWFRFGPKPVPRFDPRLWPLSILKPPGSITHSLYKNPAHIRVCIILTHLTQPKNNIFIVQCPCNIITTGPVKAGQAGFVFMLTVKGSASAFQNKTHTRMDRVWVDHFNKRSWFRFGPKPIAILTRTSSEFYNVPLHSTNPRINSQNTPRSTREKQKLPRWTSKCVFQIPLGCVLLKSCELINHQILKSHDFQFRFLKKKLEILTSIL